MCGILFILLFMDPNQITTTFIPKKPIEEIVVNTPGHRSAPAGTLFIIAIIVLILTIISVGGIIFYNKFLNSDIDQLQKSLTLSEKEYEPTLLVELTKLDKRLKGGATVLNQHVVVSPIFDLIEQNTLKTVRFSKFDLKVSESGIYEVVLAGEADNYQTIALQSQNFGDITVFKDVIFSDFTLTSKNRISFNVSFTVSRDILNFSSAPLKPVNPTSTDQLTNQSTRSEIIPQLIPSESVPVSATQPKTQTDPTKKQ